MMTRMTLAQLDGREARNGFVRSEEDYGIYVRQNDGQPVLSATHLVYDEFLFACGHVEPARFMTTGEGSEAVRRVYDQATEADKLGCCQACWRAMRRRNRAAA
jgi:hypothetical protein